MITEDEVAARLESGGMTADEAVALFRSDDVLVYPSEGVEPNTATWEQIEDLGAGSTLFAALTKAGASEEQKDEIGENIERLRAAGNTWPS